MLNTFLRKRSKILTNMLESMNTFILPESSQNLFRGIFTDELSYLIHLFKENKFEIKVAGGAVRDLLMGLTPHDIDFATDATPTEMKNLFIKNGIRLINTNGESHGTITPRINDKENFEITTLRIDKVTDGRRAEVQFTKDWKIDAERRDLTINSMFLDMDGVVHDYFDGRNDIETRTIRFVGNPRQRIQEDYLRILRYFRFYGRIAKSSNEYLPDTLDEIRENCAGLQQVSGERIWMELRKILGGNFVPDIIEKMKECKILPYLGLSENCDFSALKIQYPIMRKNDSHPAIIMSTILNGHEDLSRASKRLKFSKEDFTFMLFMIDNMHELLNVGSSTDNGDTILQHCKDRYIMHIGDPPQTKLRLCFMEYFKYINRTDLMELFEKWKAPTFPTRGDLLGRRWMLKGKELGKAMLFLKKKWKESDYSVSGDDLVNNEEFKKEFDEMSKD